MPSRVNVKVKVNVNVRYSSSNYGQSDEKWFESVFKLPPSYTRLLVMSWLNNLQRLPYIRDLENWTSRSSFDTARNGSSKNVYLFKIVPVIQLAFPLSSLCG